MATPRPECLALHHLQEGDTLLCRRLRKGKFGKPHQSRITNPQHRRTYFQSTAGAHSGFDLYDQQRTVVIPKQVPPHLLDLIAAQTPEVQKELVVARTFENSAEPSYTLAHRQTFARMIATITSVEIADIRFNAEQGREGKPCLDECVTRYLVDGLEITIPDSVNLEQYY